MNRLNLFLTIVFLFTVSSNLFGQLFSRERAQKHFDRGMMIIEYAETTDDYKKAIKQFDSAFTAYPQWPDPIYNLGLLYDKIEDYEQAKFWLDVYVLTVPNAEDIDDVKSMINIIEFKHEQFKDPKTLAGIWYWNRPKAWCEPRLEIKVTKEVVEARALYSEGTELNIDLNADRDPGQYTAKGSFVPIIWEGFEGKLSIVDAPYFSCGKSVDPEMCPSKATFYLTRKGKNTLEGKLIKTEKIYQRLDKPEIFTQEIDVVFERDEE
jgi:tetratricopeptide (TPR) repeat protein